MIDLPLRIDMLPRTNDHCICRCDIDQGGFSRICVGHPYGQWESVGVATEVDRQRTGKVQ